MWLKGTEEHAPLQLRRPDRSHYVIDEVPDLVRVRNNETGEIVEEIEVMQVWVDPLYPDAHRDPELRAMLERNSIVALIRYSSLKGFTLFPPGRTADGQWHEEGGETVADEEEMWVARRATRAAFWNRQRVAAAAGAINNGPEEETEACQHLQPQSSD